MPEHETEDGALHARRAVDQRLSGRLCHCRPPARTPHEGMEADGHVRILRRCPQWIPFGAAVVNIAAVVERDQEPDVALCRAPLDAHGAVRWIVSQQGGDALEPLRCAGAEL